MAFHEAAQRLISVMPIPNEATKEVKAFKSITRQLLRYYVLNYALD